MYLPQINLIISEFLDFYENHQEETLSFPFNLYLWMCVLEPEVHRRKAKLRLKDPNDIV